MADSEARSPAAPHSLSRDDVLRLAHLARLQLSDDEIERFAEQLSTILGYIEQLKNVPLSPPVEAPLDQDGAPSDLQRTVVPSPEAVSRLSLSPETALGNAPQTAQGLITVPSVTASDPEPTALQPRSHQDSGTT